MLVRVVKGRGLAGCTGIQPACLVVEVGPDLTALGCGSSGPTEEYHLCP